MHGIFSIVLILQYAMILGDLSTPMQNCKYEKNRHKSDYDYVLIVTASDTRDPNSLKVHNNCDTWNKAASFSKCIFSSIKIALIILSSFSYKF